MELSGGRAIEWPEATSRGAKRRVGERSEEGCPPPLYEGPGVLPPAKILKLEAQFGAFVQQIDMSGMRYAN